MRACTEYLFIIKNESNAIGHAPNSHQFKMGLTGYFVVRARGFNKFFVLPETWINKLDAKKITFFGINSNQHYLCYYSTKRENWVDAEGNPQTMPKGVPKFGISAEHIISTPNFDFEQEWESSFHAYLLRFFGELNANRFN